MSDSDPFASPHQSSGISRVTTSSAEPPGSVAPQGSWPSHPAPALAPPAKDTARTLSIVAIVLSSLALLASVGSVVFLWFPGPGFEEDLGPEEYLGTAPQVVAGKPYDGTLLAGELARTLEDYGWGVEDLTCDDVLEVAEGAESTCNGELDGEPTTVTVTFEDDAGHFVAAVDY